MPWVISWIICWSRANGRTKRLAGKATITSSLRLGGLSVDSSTLCCLAKCDIWFMLCWFTKCNIWDVPTCDECYIGYADIQSVIRDLGYANSQDVISGIYYALLQGVMPGGPYYAVLLVWYLGYALLTYKVWYLGEAVLICKVGYVQSPLTACSLLWVTLCCLKTCDICRLCFADLQGSSHRQSVYHTVLCCLTKCDILAMFTLNLWYLGYAMLSY